MITTGKAAVTSSIALATRGAVGGKSTLAPIDRHSWGRRPRHQTANEPTTNQMLSPHRNAEPMQDPSYRQEVLTRKKAMQKYYRDRDPGGEVLKKIFGPEKYKLFVSLAF